jgi:hypothetical protein
MSKEPDDNTPTFYFQPWDSIELDWNQAKCSNKSVRQMTCSHTRKSLFVPVVSDSPQRWAKHTGIEKFKFWKPDFYMYSNLDVHPKAYESF